MKKIFFLLTVASIAVWFLVLIPIGDKVLEVNFFDIGQGDAMLITTPKNQTMLIDGGPNNRVLEKLGKNLSPFQKKINIVILTHPHADHVLGLIEVLRRYEVGLLVLNGAELKSDIYYEFLKVAKEKNVKIIIAKEGMAIHFSDNLEFDIISPSKDSGDLVFGKKSESFGVSGNEVNDSSVVGKLVFKNFSIMVTGDATSKTEIRLLSDGYDLKSDILKIGHHGSKYSSSSKFLGAVSPKAAIIEVGAKNRYGHPSPAALSRLKMFDISVFRTDLNGDIKIVSDGFTTNIFTERLKN